jgi:indole-3-glycerol phosphate synthase
LKKLVLMFGLLGCVSLSSLVVPSSALAEEPEAGAGVEAPAAKAVAGNEIEPGEAPAPEPPPPLPPLVAESRKLLQQIDSLIEKVTAMEADMKVASGEDLLVLKKQIMQGKLEYLAQVKAAVGLPVLRKDFIIDPYQVYQARLAGADAILLIAEALSPTALIDLMNLANSLTLTVLLEVHELESLTAIRSLAEFPKGCSHLLGINNRNLKTMQVDIGTSIRLSEFVDNKRELISESGIKERSHVERLIKAGFGGVLIGETLMRQPDIAVKFAELFGPAENDTHD